MSYNLDSLTYRLRFTDGSSIVLLNDTEPPLTIPGGEYTFVIPNFLIGDFSGLIYSETKYDSLGNKYEFSEHGVVINDTVNFTSIGGRMMLGYKPETGQLMCHYQNPVPEFIPYLTESDKSVVGITYNSDTSGTDFSSLGDAIATGKDYYDRLNYGFYSITNVLPNIPFFSVNAFVGSHNENVIFRNFVPYSTGGTTDSTILNINTIIEDYDPTPDPAEEDPFNPWGETEPDGLDGDGDNSSDPIEIPDLPTLTAVDTGFITLFNPSLAELKTLANYMWTNPLFDLDNWRRLFADPMDAILGLSIVPVAVPDGGRANVTVGNMSTGIQMNKAASQYVTVDCGSLTVNEYWGAYLDYSPYTTAEIYLPFIGTHAINIDDIMKKTLTIKYNVDILSGACTAFIKCGSSVLYQFIGQCSASIPVTGGDFTTMINGIIHIAGSIGSMIATGGMSAPMAIGDIASTAVNTMKPNVEKSGSMSGTGGMLAVKKPYIILTRPRQAVPANQNRYTGYPSFITEALGSLSGYTEVQNVHLQNIPCTEQELNEMESLLKEGVIF